MKKHEKILQSDFVDLINLLLSDGLSSREISDMLRKKGFYISHAAIANYAKDHYQSSDDIDENEGGIDTNTLLLRAEALEYSEFKELGYKLKAVALLMVKEKLENNALSTKDIDQAKKMVDLAKLAIGY